MSPQFRCVADEKASGICALVRSPVPPSKHHSSSNAIAERAPTANLPAAGSCSPGACSSSVNTAAKGWSHVARRIRCPCKHQSPIVSLTSGRETSATTTLSLHFALDRGGDGDETESSCRLFVATVYVHRKLDASKVVTKYLILFYTSHNPCRGHRPPIWRRERSTSARQKTAISHV